MVSIPYQNCAGYRFIRESGFLPYPESEICEDPELGRECDYNISRSQDY